MQQIKNISGKAILALLAFFAGCVFSMAQTKTREISIVHSAGTTEVPIKSSRIVVMDFGALERLKN